MKKLPGKADEVRHMLFLMPIVLMAVITNFEDPMYLLLSAMINMCRIICAEKITESQRELLNHYIYIYFDFRNQCLPNINLRPKHNFLQHYPDLIKQFGPLKNLSSLHFEHKHQYFKNIAKSCKNFKNITLTMTKKQQCFQASLYGELLAINIVCKNVNHLKNGMFNMPIPDDYLYVTKKITYLGTVYKENDVILCLVDTQSNINVLFINSIFISKDYSDFICYGEIQKMWYNSILNLYESFPKIRDKQFCTIKRNQFVLPQPIKCFKSDHKYYYAPFSSFGDI